MEVIQVSLVIPLGTVIKLHSMTLLLGLAGTRVSGPLTVISGLISQPSSGHFTWGGASLALPSGAPASAHLAMVSISAALRERSFEKWPNWGSANHGGIFLVATAVFIAFAHGRVLS